MEPHSCIGSPCSTGTISAAALPAILGEAEQDLVRVLGPIPELACIWRVLTTAELRRSPHVGAFFDFVVDEVEALQAILTGEPAAEPRR